MKIIAIILFVLASQFCDAQDVVPTEQQARDYFANTDPELLTTITVFEEEDAELYDLYVRKNPGDILITGTTISKIVSNGQTTVYNCSMITFDVSKEGAKEIEKIQKTIISKYKFGISFEELAEKYRTPETTHLDVNFETDTMSGDLKTAIETHSPKEIFVVDLNGVYSYVMIVNSFPVKVKSVTLSQAEYK